jgi:hypothetical protein
MLIISAMVLKMAKRTRYKKSVRQLYSGDESLSNLDTVILSSASNQLASTRMLHNRCGPEKLSRIMVNNAKQSCVVKCGWSKSLIALPTTAVLRLGKVVRVLSAVHSNWCKNNEVFLQQWFAGMCPESICVFKKTNKT